MKDLTGPVHLASLRSKERGKKYFTFRVSKSESQQLMLQGEMMVPEIHKPEEAPDLSKKTSKRGGQIKDKTLS